MSDSALKAVGVGSVGTRCAVTVFAGDDPDDMLVLQGKRVVQGQRLMQTASDPVLGWGTNPRGDHIDVRQFRDWKPSVEVSQLDGAGLKDYGKLCGWALAEADYRLLLEAIAAGRVPTVRTSLSTPLSKGGEFSTPLHSGS